MRWYLLLIAVGCLGLSLWLAPSPSLAAMTVEPYYTEQQTMRQADYDVASGNTANVSAVASAHNSAALRFYLNLGGWLSLILFFVMRKKTRAAPAAETP